MAVQYRVTNNPSGPPTAAIEGSGLPEYGEIHPIWAASTFRNADHRSVRHPAELDIPAFDFSPQFYARISPALRLATLFLYKVMPDLARIHNHPFSDQTSPTGELFDRLIADFGQPNQFSEDALAHELLGMASTYRITLDRTSQMDEEHPVNASTGYVKTRHDHLPHPDLFVQTSVDSSYLDWIQTDRWATTSDHGKRLWTLSFATLLVHELAHAIWFQRMIAVSRTQFQNHLRVDAVDPEPRFVGYHRFCELGYAIELQLFGGVFNFEFKPEEEPRAAEDSNPLFLSLVTYSGRAVAVHALLDGAIATLVNPHNWTRSEDGTYPVPIVEVSPNLLDIGETVETAVSRYPAAFLSAPGYWPDLW